MERMRLSPANDPVPGELSKSVARSLGGSGFLVVVDEFRATNEGIRVGMHVRGRGAGDAEDRAGVGGPGQAGASVWLEAGDLIVLSNIVSGQCGFDDDNQTMSAEYDLWFPIDLGSLGPEGVEVVVSWSERTKHSLRVRLPGDELVAAAGRALHMQS